MQFRIPIYGFDELGRFRIGKIYGFDELVTLIERSNREGLVLTDMLIDLDVKDTYPFIISHTLKLRNQNNSSLSNNNYELCSDAGQSF